MTIKNQLFWIIALVGMAIDQLTKYWVMQGMELGQTIPIWEDVFHFTFVTNRGAAFSMFSGGVVWLRWLSLIVSLGLMAFAVFGPVMRRLEQLGYGFILAGAAGNGIDRFVAGEVVDFLDFRWLQFPVLNLNPLQIQLIPFPVFNIADVCINIGIVCLLIAAFWTPPTTKGSNVRRNRV